jgi:hypothetical protein
MIAAQKSRPRLETEINLSSKKYLLFRQTQVYNELFQVEMSKMTRNMRTGTGYGSPRYDMDEIQNHYPAGLW